MARGTDGNRPAQPWTAQQFQHDRTTGARFCRNPAITQHQHDQGCDGRQPGQCQIRSGKWNRDHVTRIAGNFRRDQRRQNTATNHKCRRTTFLIISDRLKGGITVIHCRCLISANQKRAQTHQQKFRLIHTTRHDSTANHAARRSQKQSRAPAIMLHDHRQRMHTNQIAHNQQGQWQGRQFRHRCQINSDQ